MSAEFRETFARLLADHRANVAKWLAQVADPARALELLDKIPEHGAPPLSRAKVTPSPDAHRAASHPH